MLLKTKYKWILIFCLHLLIYFFAGRLCWASIEKPQYNGLHKEKWNLQTRFKRQVTVDATTPSAQLPTFSTMLHEGKNCSINIKKLGYDYPLIIDPVDHTQFLYPDENGTIFLRAKQIIFLSCPGKNNFLKKLNGTRSFNFSCVCDTTFKGNGIIYNFTDLTCEQPPKYDIVDKGFFGRESEFRKFEIGFNISGSRDFMKLIYVHYDRTSTSTMYVKSAVSRHLTGAQKPARNRFDQTQCCGRQRYRPYMDEIYDYKTQDRSFAVQLYCHDSEFSTKCSYVNQSSATIFYPAQLTPRSSFVYTSASIATFVYLNTGPQWRSINEGNWARIEDHVNEMAKELKKDLIVFTGVYDNLRLKDTGDDGKEKLMYLFANENEVRFIGIPLYFWKIVYEPESKKGVVYVTVNNLHMENPEDYHICEKPLFSKDGVQMPKQWKPKNIAKGYSYMCEVSDFVRSTDIPFHDYFAKMTELLYVTKKK